MLFEHKQRQIWLIWAYLGSCFGPEVEPYGPKCVVGSTWILTRQHNNLSQIFLKSRCNKGSFSYLKNTIQCSFRSSTFHPFRKIGNCSKCLFTLSSLLNKANLKSTWMCRGPSLLQPLLTGLIHGVISRQQHYRSPPALKQPFRTDSACFCTSRTDGPTDRPTD